MTTSQLVRRQARREKLLEMGKKSFNKKQISHKILFSPWPDSTQPYSRLLRWNWFSILHAHTQPEGCIVAIQMNGGKHVTFNPLVRVTARPLETSERMDIMKMIRPDSPRFLPRQEIKWITAPNFQWLLDPHYYLPLKHTVGAEVD